jgi:hypothetical protein
MASGHVNRIYRPNTWQHRPSLRREDFSCQPGAVHTWHNSDMPKYVDDVRCWVNSGKHLLAASISVSDPTATSVNISCCGSEVASAPIKTLV